MGDEATATQTTTEYRIQALYQFLNYGAKSNAIDTKKVLKEIAKLLALPDDVIL